MKAIILLLAALVSLPAASHTLELTYFLKSNHFGKTLSTGEAYNGDHNFVGLEYRTGDHGFALSSFTNSYYKQSYMASYATYWQPYAKVETGLRIGLSSGYDGFNECLGDGLYSACPVVALEVSYTAFSLVVPKLSLMPGVVALSFSARF